MADFLDKAGFAVNRYHGQLSARDRKENQNRFMADELKAMVATNAFGMGIGKPDLTQQFFMAGRYPRFEDMLAVYCALAKADQAPMKLAQLQEVVGSVARTKIRVILSLLKAIGWLKESRGSRLTLLKCDVAYQELEQLAQQYQQKSEHDQDKLERMMRYAQSAFCRWRVLLEYFGEDVPQQRCGHCDNCLHPWEERIELPVSVRDR